MSPSGEDQDSKSASLPADRGFHLDGGHPRAGKAEWRDQAVHQAGGESAILKKVFEASEREGWEEIVLPVSAGGLRLSLDPDLAKAVTGLDREAPDFFTAALKTARDHDEIASRLDQRGDAALTAAVLERSETLETGRPDLGVLGLNRCILEIRDRSVRAVLLQTAFVRRVRIFTQAGRAGPDGPNHAANLKKDAGLFLLLLSEQRRRLFYINHLMDELVRLLGPRSAFLHLLLPFLRKLPFVEEVDPVDTEHGRVFADARAFDTLPLSSKLSAILGGNLAWYTVLAARLPRFLAPLFRRLTPHYEPAYRLIGASSRQGYLVKRGFMRRAFRNLFRGDLPGAVEFFWSGWNPVLVQITIRPFYRMLGGNRHPLLASTFTFLYTSVVVHPLWLAAAVMGGFRLAAVADPAFRWGRLIGADGNFIVLAAAVGAYGFMGFLSGLSKSFRERRRVRL